MASVSPYTLQCVRRPGEEFLGVPIVGVGAVPADLPRPDLYVQVRCGGQPHLRLDVYGELLLDFRAMILGHHVVCATEGAVHLLDLDSQRVVTRFFLQLRQVFPIGPCILLASRDELLCMREDGGVNWRRIGEDIRVVVVGNEGALVEATFPPAPAGYYNVDLETGDVRPEEV